MSGELKRKYEAVEDDYSSSFSSSSSSPSSFFSCTSSGWDSEEECCRGETNDMKARTPYYLNDFSPLSIIKQAKRRKKNNVQFDQVTVYYFQRCQGFTSVPSRGGCTLGMVRRHSSCRQYTLEEFAKEQDHFRRQKLKDRLKEEKLQALKLKLTKNGSTPPEEVSLLTIDDISDDDVDVNSVDTEDGFFLQPYSAKRRRTLLKMSGVKKIDKEEKRELHEIRLSREDCGCNCQGFCEPDTCSCSLEGIKCQMDRSSFPCGCTKDGCGNIAGRIEFNSARVQTHFIHTITRLELEKKQQNEEVNENRNADNETLISERVHHFGYSARQSIFEDRTVPLTPAFHFSMELENVGENSCSSDMTDSSVSSNQSDDSEEHCEGVQLDKSQSDVDDDGLARILHFNDSDNEDGGGDHHNAFSYFNASDFFSDHAEGHTGTYLEKLSCENHTNPLAIPDCLDENANQDASFSLKGTSERQSDDCPHTVLSAEQSSKSYTDLSLSSDSFELFHSFSDYNPGSLYNSLKEYENVDNFSALQFQFPPFQNYPLPVDQNSCFIESLIGLSESVPELSPSFSDGQFFEDTIKSSMMETVQV